MKKFFSLLLVAIMVMASFSVAIVSTSAASDGESATIDLNGDKIAAHVGDTIKYTLTLDVSKITSDGIVTGIGAEVYYDKSKLEIQNLSEIADVLGSTKTVVDRSDAVAFNGTDVNSGYDFSTEKVLTDVVFKVIGSGSTSVTGKFTALYKIVNGSSEVYIGPTGVTSAPISHETLVVTDCPHPTAPAGKAVVSIYGLDGSVESREFNVGDEFTVYTTLNVGSEKIASVQGVQTYTSSVLTLMEEFDEDGYGDIVDVDKVFPIIGDKVIANAAQPGKIVYNSMSASNSNPFYFNADDAKLIVTTYKVTAEGTASVENELINLAIADNDYTCIVYQGEVQEGKTVAGAASFTDPTPEIDHAVVTIHNLDGTKEVKNFNIGDEFTVYTTLNASASAADGKVSAVQAAQRFTESVLDLTIALDDDGYVAQTATVFPVMQDEAMGVVKPGILKYVSATEHAFTFASDGAELAVTTYKVKAAGYADIRNSIIVLAAADEDATKIVFGGVTQADMSYSSASSFTAPEDQPTESTEATQPTEATQSTEDTQSTEPTVAPNKTVVTITGPNGSKDTMEVNVGDTFTVYTVLDVSASVSDGKIANIDAKQQFSADKLQLIAELNPSDNTVVDTAAMFPILGDEANAAVINGAINFVATRGGIGAGYVFNSDTCKLIVTNYKATAAGAAAIDTTIADMRASDAAATKIVYKGELQAGKSIDIHAQYTDPEAPTEPTQATEATQATDATDATEATQATDATQATEATQATDATQATEATQIPSDSAVITIYGLDGTTETKTFKIGDTFTVYTTLNAADCTGAGHISSITAEQTFSSEILAAAVESDTIGMIESDDDMFPILKDKAQARFVDDSTIRYNAFDGRLNKGFVFDTDESLLFVISYTVTGTGAGEVRNVITTLAAADSGPTVLVENGVIKESALKGASSFTEPGTEPLPETATIVIYGLNGQTETKVVNVGDSFIVYTLLNAAECAGSGKIASVNGTQTFTASVLNLNGSFDAENMVTYDGMFPVLGEYAMARLYAPGELRYNATVGSIDKPFVFASDSAVLIATSYTVLTAGSAEVRNSLTTMAVANEELSRLVDKGTVLDDKLTVTSTFTEPVPEPTQATDEPTQSTEDTQSSEATEDTQATEPSGATESTDNTEPTEDTQATEDTEATEGKVHLLGDVDENNKVDIVDATFIQRYATEIKTPYDEGIVLYGNVDGNTKTDIVDATFVQRYATEIKTPYPIGEPMSIS